MRSAAPTGQPTQRSKPAQGCAGRELALDLAIITAALAQSGWALVLAPSLHLGHGGTGAVIATVLVIGIALLTSGAVALGAHHRLTRWLPRKNAELTGHRVDPIGHRILNRRRLVWYAAVGLLVPGNWAYDTMVHPGHSDHPGWELPTVLLSAALLALLFARLEVALRYSDALRRQVSFQAGQDALTGLANRDRFRSQLRAALTEDDQNPVALVLVDLDDFKEINDTLGHRLGDEVLVAVADRLRGIAQSEASLARLGGDEFGMIIEDLLEPDFGPDPGRFADLIVERLSAPYQIGDQLVRLTASVGLVVTDGPTSTSTALQNADLALYAAKNAGKSQTRRYDPSLREAHLAHSKLTEGLRQAVARNEFTVFYQPVVELATGRITAVEALLRWHGPDGSPVSPAVFIPAAEEIGLIGQLGAWVLERACSDALQWHTRYGISLTVNVSGRQLRDPGFADQVLATLRRSGFPARALVLEITETVLVTSTSDETEAASRKLARLRAHGVRIAIDDFGTGYSSFGYLRSLPIDVIKIDRSFVVRVAEGTATTSPDRVLLRALLELTASLYLQPVAEGVETTDQASALRELGCRYVQGFLFARPAPPETVNDLLQKTKAALALPSPQ